LSAGPESSDAGPESSDDNEGIGMAGSEAKDSRLEEALVGMFEGEGFDGSLLLLLDTVVFGAVTVSRFAPGSNDFEPEFAWIDLVQPAAPTKSKPPSNRARQGLERSVRIRLSLL